MKYSRHARILELIEVYSIETQDELAEKLKEAGMDVTQATISRDIKELRLTKVMMEDGRYKYSAISTGEGAEAAVSNKLLNVFTDSFISSDYANHIVVIKTLPGMAQAAASVVDSLKWSDILGTIAGDDTVMIICRAEKIAEELVNKFNKMTK